VVSLTNTIEYNQGRIQAQNQLADGVEAMILLNAVAQARGEKLDDYDKGFVAAVKQHLRAK